MKCKKVGRKCLDFRCISHTTEELRDKMNNERRNNAKKCAVDGCQKEVQSGLGGYCQTHTPQALKDERNTRRNSNLKKNKRISLVDTFHNY